MTYMLCELWYSCEEHFPKFCEPWLPLKQVERKPESREYLYMLSMFIKYLSIVVGRFLVFAHIYKEIKRDRHNEENDTVEQIDNNTKKENESKTVTGKTRRRPKLSVVQKND